jgi:hypothetical protein
MLLQGLFLPPTSRLQQLILNQAILNTVREVVDVEVFDRSTILTELYTLWDGVPMHLVYFSGLMGVLYSQKDKMYAAYSHWKTDGKMDVLLDDIPRVRRIVRATLFVSLFLFAKNVESAR